MSINLLGKKRAAEIIKEVYECLNKKGYNPNRQIVGYLLSGDPSYITSNARKIIQQVDRYELLEYIVTEYTEQNIK